MTEYVTIRVSAEKYEDAANCLAACEADIASERGLLDYQVSNARWEDEFREAILVDVPDRRAMEDEGYDFS